MSFILHHSLLHSMLACLVLALACSSVAVNQASLAVTESQVHTLLEIDFTNPHTANATKKTLTSMLSIGYGHGSIRDYRVTGSPYLGDWALVQRVFEMAPGVRNIYWESQHPVPSTILRSLESHQPLCRLHYTVPLGFEGDPYDPAYHIDPDWDPYDGFEPGHWKREALLQARTTDLLPSIINSRNLYSLTAEVVYTSDDDFSSMELILNTLVSAPNLRKVDLHIHSVGCIVGSSPRAFDFRSKPTARFPPLEVLKIRGYSFSERSDGGHIWQYKGYNYDWVNDTPPATPERREDDGRSNLDVWMEIMDWSKLHTLELGSPDIATLNKLRGRNLPNLRHLVLEFPDGQARSTEIGIDESVFAFVAETQQPLKSQSLHNIRSVTWDHLLHPTRISQSPWRELQSFYVGSDDNSVFLNINSLHSFIATSTVIESLDINIPRCSHHLVDEKHKLIFTSSPSLHHLTLRLPTPDSRFLDDDLHDNETLIEEYHEVHRLYKLRGDEGDEPDPLVNEKNALELFQELRGKKIGRKLESLEVYAGNWVKRDICDFTDRRPSTRVARYRCFVDAQGGAGCEGKQTRNLGGFW